MRLNSCEEQRNFNKMFFIIIVYVGIYLEYGSRTRVVRI